MVFTQRVVEMSFVYLDLKLIHFLNMQIYLNLLPLSRNSKVFSTYTHFCYLIVNHPLEAKITINIFNYCYSYIYNCKILIFSKNVNNIKIYRFIFKFSCFNRILWSCSYNRLTPTTIISWTNTT